MKVISRGGAWQVDVPTRVVKTDLPERPENDRRIRIVVRVWLGEYPYDCNCRIDAEELEKLGNMPEDDIARPMQKYVRRVELSPSESHPNSAPPGAVGISEIRLESIDGMYFFDAPVE